jgi:hypothetical protein
MVPGLQTFPTRTKPNLQLVHDVGLAAFKHVKQFAAQDTHTLAFLNVLG